MRRNDLVLRQHTVDRRAQACRYDLFRRVSEDVVDGEVGRDALANFPALDLFTNGDDLARQVGARNDVLLLTERVLALGHDEVTILDIP